eukprot:5647353-Pyramimonas_sp.AAC.1
MFALRRACARIGEDVDASAHACSCTCVSVCTCMTGAVAPNTFTFSRVLPHVTREPLCSRGACAHPRQRTLVVGWGAGLVGSNCQGPGPPVPYACFVLS